MNLNYLFDTIYEFWQFLKPQRNVYLVGKYHNGKIILIRMIPESISAPVGWEVLTQPMTKAQAELRINSFKLMRVVSSKKSSESAS